MEFHVIRSDPGNAESMRRIFLNESPFQFVHNKCHGAGRVPAARCNIANIASQRTLIHGGMKIFGHMMVGEV